MKSNGTWHGRVVKCTYMYRVDRRPRKFESGNCIQELKQRERIYQGERIMFWYNVIQMNKIFEQHLSSKLKENYYTILFYMYTYSDHWVFLSY